MKIRYSIKPKIDPKYNGSNFSIEIMKSVFTDIFIKDPTRTINIKYNGIQNKLQN